MASPPEPPGSTGLKSTTRAAVVVACLVLAFGVMAVAMIDGFTLGVDEAILLALRSSSEPGNPAGPAWLWEAGRDITALGSLSVLTLVTLTFCGFLLIVKRRMDALQTVVTILGGEALNTALKKAFDRPRPEISQSVRVFTASFPSGHAAMSAVTFLTIAFVASCQTASVELRRYYLATAIFMSGIVGLSRLYLGVHYPSDVLAGWCVGAAWAILCGHLASLARRSSE